MKLNINEQVRVKLTAAGIKEYERYYRELMPVGTKEEYFYPRLDAEGWHRTQLWCLMQEFGPAIYMGMPDVFFENNEIEVIEK